MKILKNLTAQFDSNLQKNINQKILISYIIIGNRTMTQDFIFAQVTEKHI